MFYHQYQSLPLDTILRWFYLHPKLTNYLFKLLSISWSNAMHVFLQSWQCPTCFGVGHHHHLQARQHHWPKNTAVRRCLILPCTHRYISRPFIIELSMYSLNVYKFSYRLNVSVRVVLDQLVDINLIDTHGASNIVEYILKSYLTVFLPSL
jgi:hypothetical protein